MGRHSFQQRAWQDVLWGWAVSHVQELGEGEGGERERERERETESLASAMKDSQVNVPLMALAILCVLPAVP